MADETPIEASAEVTEKEIDLAQPEQINPESNILTKPVEPNFIPKKPVAELTDADKATIIANYQNGINQPFYDVKQFKNGKYRILKRKESKPSVAQKAISDAQPPAPPKAEKKVYYSDNQLLFEHIIELNAKVDRLMSKHKKLKRRYQALQSDIYVDDSETGRVADDSADERCEVETRDEQNEQKIEQTKSDIAPVRTVPQHIQRGWRSQVTFL